MKIVQAAYTGTHRYSFRSGEKGLITGVKMVKPDGSSEYRACFEVQYYDGFVDYAVISEFGDFEVGKNHEPSAEEIEIERLARLMCTATYGSGMEDQEVNRGNLPVLGYTGMRFMLPGPLGRQPLWHDFRDAAAAVVKDRPIK